MSFSKEFIEVLLAASQDYKESMILDYNQLPANIPTRIYVDFAKLNANHPERVEKVEPFELFLLMYPEPNAWAWLHNDKYVICIHLSLFKIIENRVKEKLKTIPENGKVILSKCNFISDAPADYLIYQFATIFTFYHELGHLLQFNREEQKHNAAHFERYNLAEGVDFDKLAHAREIDADIFAAEHMNAHVFQYWAALPTDRKTKESLEVLMSLCLLSSFILFFELSDGWKEWYTLDYDHPNSLIRVCYIHDVLCQVAKQNEPKIGFEVDSQKVLDNTLELAEYFLDDKDSNGLDSYVKLFANHSNEISNYIKEVMFPYLDEVSFLNCNNS